MDNNQTNYTEQTIKNFINNIITYNSVDDILNTCQTDQIKGFIFERLFDIIIKFGFCDIFPNSKYNHIVGNVNNQKLIVLNSITNYVNGKTISGNSSGCSDITLKNKETNTYIFISSKYFNEEKTVDSYDIQNIVALTDAKKHVYAKYEIYLVVKNKLSLINNIKNANKSSDYITKYMIPNNILDVNDLNRYFLSFKQHIAKNLTNDWNTIYSFKKDNLQMRFHQELITQKTLTLIKQNHKSFLWGCKCRSGKTYMVGGLINKMYDSTEQKKLNILVITPAPTETMPQFVDDLFEKFRDFDKFNIHNITNGLKANKLQITSTYNIFIASKQLLQKNINNKTINPIKNSNIDIIFFDENHFGGTTDLSKEILNSYATQNTVKIYLTATYFKPLQEWNILPICQMFWDLEDEQICKKINDTPTDLNNIQKLYTRHEKTYIDGTIAHFINLGETQMFKPYENMPNLHLITNIFDYQRYEIIKEKITDSKYGFSFDALFSLNNEKQFIYRNEIKLILRYISGSEKEIDFKDGDKSILGRINKIASRHSFVQIWFLPSDGINETSQNLKSVMHEDKIFQQYEIMCVNRKNNELAKDVKADILNQENIARSSGKRGLILLAGNMLSLGITINSCDIVVLLNNILSSDKNMQQMCRCLTEGNGKKCGFVVDLNISRVLHTCMNYSTNNPNNTIENKIQYIIENNLINIDSDLMHNKQINHETIIKKLIDIWKGDPINGLKILLNRLENDMVIFDNATQKMLNSLFSSSIKNKVCATVMMKDFDDELQEFPSGVEKIKINGNPNENNADAVVNDIVNEPIEEKIKISFTKHVLPHVIPLVCILTIKNNNRDFALMLNDIKQNPELLEIFNDQCHVWWNKTNLIDVITDIVNKGFNKTSHAFNVTMQIKLSLQSLLDKPNELFELIASCLKPNIVEKQNNGEVFTPMDFINNCMLKDVETYWQKTHNENIWTNEKLKWYDPATGMGNYPIAIYYKLLDGLKDKIKNETQRKKHIIENQLFMGELNKKNCYIIRQIFNITQQYELNLYEGDTLNVDLNNVFKTPSFDIIIGNPPYNESFGKSGASPLYHKFIEFYVNKCNILSFVTPSRWFSGGKGLETFRDSMLQKTNIVSIKHFDNASDIFGNYVEIKGGVNYFLIDNRYNGLCNYNGNMITLSKFDVLIDSKYYGIVSKLSQFNSICNIYMGRCFGIESNDASLSDNDKLVKCFVSQQKGFIKYIDPIHIKKEYNFHKVITARASHKANSGFGNMFVGNTNEVHTGSYVSFKVSTENEANSLLSYLKCKLPNFMLSLRKQSQDISDNTCKWIPLLPLNKIWIDADVYKFFGLSDDEIKIITDTHVVGFKD